MRSVAKKNSRRVAAPALAAAKRPLGRPRSQESEDAILAVTLDLLGQRGYAGLTVDEIVARARVSKGTIYRRWPTKEELVVAAFDRLPELEVVDRGSVVGEFLELARQYDHFLHQTPLASVLPGLISEATHNTALAQRLEATFQRRRLPARTIVVRGLDRGDLPPDTDIELATELFMAPLIQRSFFATHRMNLQAFREMFDVILTGVWEVHKRARRGTSTRAFAKPLRPRRASIRA